MVEGKKSRLREVAKDFNVGINTIVEFLEKKGIHIDNNPNSRIEGDAYKILFKEYATDIHLKKESEKLNLNKAQNKPQAVTIDQIEERTSDDDEEIRVKDYTSKKVEEVKQKPKEEELIRSTAKTEIKVVGKIDLDKKGTPEEKKPEIVEEKVKEAVSAEKKPEKEEVVPVEKVKEEPKIEHPEVVDKIDVGESKPQQKPKQKTENKERPKEAPTAHKVEKEKAKQPKSKHPSDSKKKSPTDKNVVVETPKKTEKKEETKENPITTPEEVIFSPFTAKKLAGPTVVGKIDLPVDNRKKNTGAASDDAEQKKKKKRRKRIKKEKQDATTPQAANVPAKPRVIEFANPHRQAQSERKKAAGAKRRPVAAKQEVSEEDVARQIKDTLARLTNKSKSKTSRYRRDKRDAAQVKMDFDSDQVESEKNIMKVTEFVSVNDIANMMDVPVNEIISTCMNMGLFVSINQRLDAETMALVVDEFGYKIEFVSADVLEAINDDEIDDDEDMFPRPPIVTVMGHVDHGKTSLLDYIRKANVIAGEAGGITQHIGAYSVELSSGRIITFLDTPGHEAFTAMRARGAQVTDVAIIVIASDDSIMPQTREAINHAQAAGVPIIFAINKIDRENARPEKIKEELAAMNILVEDWGGKYQSHDISAKLGLHVDELLEKVLLEADVLELKANPDRRASGTIIESQLDKGRGFVATILVQTGTLSVGDIIISGTHYGHVKAMFNERGQRVQSAGPSTPIQVLGLNGAPMAGEKFNVMETPREAKEIALRRDHLAREQSIRTQKHITLDEIGRRIAIGNFQELNLIVKGDVDGSIEALSDSLLKLSNNEVQVQVIHKAVGQISESDVLLAAASNAIIIGFQVRPSLSARKLAENEEIDIRLYSIIYDAINEIKDAIEGMLSPDIKEQILGTAEIIEAFKITKVGTIAGCIVREGKIKRNNRIRVIRDGIVVYTGELGSLKRFKDDVKEVANGFECGMNVDRFNDIKAGDFIEAFEEVEVRKKL
ncbi:MAG: translation initiation factor IF-2 [Salinivirgaceae bacterium]|nr:translation initiation factor IF-2 [Salinivirgaceae bacterium]MDD4747265.1 translation initiation factor IF-2 [Salinivirgaceae bacterium]MDY0279888.1 translation initiation factor IF-2 [Salinivirgaceae bacterium]